MGYYWVTEAQKYIQSLGFGTTRRPVNKESQDIRTDQYGLDNSFSWDKHDYLRFGKGGVDDAEDAEVILHEYGHAIQDAEVTGFGVGPEAGGIGEGFGDYWAVTVSNLLAPTPDAPCVADWDSVSYTAGPIHCLRRIDTNGHYPEDLGTEVHPMASSGRARCGTSARRSGTSRPTRSSSRANSRSRRTPPCQRQRGRRWPRPSPSTAPPRRIPSEPPSRRAGSSNGYGNHRLDRLAAPRRR